MVCDFLRSCYSQKISYVAGDPSIQATATWYFAAPGALPLPTGNAFCSPTWDTVHPTATTLGFDATSKRTYYNGKRLNASDGTNYAGPLAYFTEGAPGPAVLPRSSDGFTPLSCIPPAGKFLSGTCIPAVPSSGVKNLTGMCTEPITPGTPCANCSGTTPLTRTCTIAGCTGVAAPANGTWTCTQLSFNPCFWLATGAGGVQILVQKLAGGLGVTCSVGFLSNQLYQLFPVTDCITLQTLPQFSTFSPLWPATITVQ
jgi:hypothetical protein